MNASPPVPAPFLTARWESLVLLNFECAEDALSPYLPAGTQLDPWQGKHLISLVGFRFVDTRVRRRAVPLHRDFEEVNLRFYVRRSVDSEVRRGVVFIRELVPRRVIATVARWLYEEPYIALPMSHTVDLDATAGGSARYRWWYRRQSFELSASTSGSAEEVETGSEAEFITEHYWGYTRRRDGTTSEYQVDHDPWRIWKADRAHVSGPLQSIYGPSFGSALARPPVSAYVAVGGPVTVYSGRRIGS